MSLAVGTSLGPYEVLAPLGAGGMGEVYRARDTRLDRAVALKVLPADFAADPARRARFEREARTISQLNHPHICVLHDVGEAVLPGPESRVPSPASRTVSYLVMEYLEGKTLAHRLTRGALPLAQALDYAAQIADALATAHKRGVIHRDLKPSNIMLARSGSSGPPVVKLLDFGLAKLVEPSAAPAPTTAGPNGTETLTTDGKVVGTLPYMAPEQLEKKPADARTDVWALGCVLYEMLAGRRAFEGTSDASLTSAIMRADPLATLLPLTPTALEHVVRQCLAKDPDERWQSAGDVQRELAWISSQQTVGSARSTRRRRLSPPAVACLAMVAGTAAALGFAAALVWWVPWRYSPAPVPLVTRAQIAAALAPPPWDEVAISPDGRAVAYLGTHEGRRRIFLRRLDADEATPVPDTEDAFVPVFSPDSRWLAFFAADSLKKVLLPAGPTEALVPNLSNPGGATWTRDDTIIFATTQRARVLLRVPASGGPPVQLMEADTVQGEWHLWKPALLPDGRTLLVTASDESCERTRIVALPLDGRPRRTLLERAADARYLPTGHLLFVRESAVLVAPFDPTRAELLGPAVPLGERVSLTPCVSAALSVSDDGVLAYAPPGPASSGPMYRPVLVDRAGGEVPANVGPQGDFVAGRVSPDGKRVAAMLSQTDPYVAVVDLARGVTTRLTTGGAGFWPIWSPDGRRVAFSLIQAGAPNINIYWRLADGSAPVERLTSGNLAQNPRAFTPDGRLLIFQQHLDPQTGFDIWAVPLGPGAAPRPLLSERYHEYHASLSPDGHWLAYVAEESGRPEVYVRPFPALNGQWQVSANGGLAPVWSLDGRELFYQQGEMASDRSRMFTVRVETSSGFRAEAPRLLFEGPYLPANRYGHFYDVVPDGQRFLMVKVKPPPAPTEIRIVFNWFEELKAKVPPGRWRSSRGIVAAPVR